MEQARDSDFRLDGKVIVMTGAAGILGASAVARFLDAGARVCALDVSAQALDRLGTGHDSLLKLAVDVTDKESLRAAQQQLHERWGTADALFNNAAAKSENVFAPFEEFPLADWN